MYILGGSSEVKSRQLMIRCIVVNSTVLRYNVIRISLNALHVGDQLVELGLGLPVFGLSFLVLLLP